MGYHWVRALAVALLVLTTLAAAPAAATTSTTSTTSTITFLRPATVRAGGAGAVVALRIACVKGDAPPLNAFVREDFADGTYAVAGGYLPFGFVCGARPQSVRVPLQAGFIAGGLGPFESDLPLRPGPATARIGFGTCCSPTSFSAPQPIVLSNRTDLDHVSSPAGRLALRAVRVANGAAVDVYVRETCAPGSSFAASVSGLTQTAGRHYVEVSLPYSPIPAPACAATPRWFGVRMYPTEFAVHAGTAFVEYGGLWSQVTVR